jgi:hypothetical protein
MLDKLPAWARHLVIVVAVAALVVISQGVANGGVSSISWKDAGNAAAAALVAQLLLILTPLTNQYGVAKKAGAPRIR